MPAVVPTDYGQPPDKSGLVVMDSPAMTDFVIAGLLGAGAHLMVNCCGAGPANRMPFVVGASGPVPIMPVIKITGSTRAFRQRANLIDFDAGGAVRRNGDVGALAARFVKLIVRACGGRATRTQTPRDFFLNVPIDRPQA